MTEIQGKSILVPVSARFELARIRVIESRLCIQSLVFKKLKCITWVLFCTVHKDLVRNPQIFFTFFLTRLFIFTANIMLAPALVFDTVKRKDSKKSTPPLFSKTYSLLPLVTPCYPCYPLLPLVTLVTLVTPCYPLLPLLPLVTLVNLVTPCYPRYPRYPLLPLVTLLTPCYPLLPLLPFVTLVNLVTPCYPCYPCYPLLPLLPLSLIHIWRCRRRG